MSDKTKLTNAERKIETIRITKDTFFANRGEEFSVFYEGKYPSIEYVSNWLDAGEMKSKGLDELEGFYEVIT